jgi:predicted outer membrane repeat protein
VLRRVTVAENSTGENGGGIFSSVDSTLRVFASTIDGNSAGEKGGGIYSLNTDLLVTASSITNNEVTGGISSGGGVDVSEGSTLFFNSAIENNVSNGNGGGLVVRNGFARLQNTRVNSNSSMDVGGGIHLRNSKLVLVGGEVSFNAATQSFFGSRAGAVNIDDDSSVFVRGGTRFESNSAQGFGGAFQVTGLLSVQDAEFVSNSAGSGGAIFVHTSGRAYFQRTQFSANQSEDNGSAIFVRGEFFATPILILTDSTFSENEVTGSEDGHSVTVNEDTFWRESGSTFIGNTSNDGVGVV